MSKSKARSAGRLAVAAAVLAWVAGCAEEPEEPQATRDEVVDACFEYGEAACRAFGRCLGQTAQEIDACIEREQDACGDELEAESCWGPQRDAYLRCSDIEDESCADVCGDDGFCFDYCPYFCPTQRVQEVERASW